MDEKKPEVKEVKTPTLEDLQKQIEALTAENSALKADAEKVKKTISNANADAAEWKSKYRATLDEAKRKEEERAEADETLRAELTALKTEKRIATYTSKFLECGYDAQTAASMAMSLPEGISDDFFEKHRSFIESTKQNAITNAINNQSSMSVGETPSSKKDDEVDANIRRWFNGY